MDVLSILRGLGYQVDNVNVTDDVEVFRGWVKEYLDSWYGKVDELLETVILKTAVDGGMYVLFYPDSRIDVFLRRKTEENIYSSVGSIIQGLLGLKISGLFLVKTVNCPQNVNKSIEMIILALNSILTNIVNEVISYSLVHKIASNRYLKGIRKSMKKTKKELEKAVREGIIPEQYGLWGIWLIDAVFFGKDSEISDAVEVVGVRRDRESLLNLLHLIVKRGKDFGIHISIEERKDDKGRDRYLLKSTAVLDCSNIQSPLLHT